jgi:hypothetical protein
MLTQALGGANMVRIGVWHTLGEAARFAFGRYWAILGAMWLPAALLAAAGYFAYRPVLEALPGLMAHLAQHPRDVDAMQDFARSERYVPAFNLASLFLFPWIAVGVTREALGLRRGLRFVYFPPGMAELRVVGAILLLYALLICVSLAALFVVGLVAGIGAVSLGGGADWSALKPWAHLAVLVAVFSVLGGFIYCAVRLLALLVPVTVAERRFGLIRSWELSAGHFWPLFGIGCAVVISILVLEVLVGMLIGVPIFVMFGQDIARAAHAGPQQVTTMFGARIVPLIAIVSGVSLPALPLLYGFQIGVWAFAYRALVPETPA